MLPRHFWRLRKARADAQMWEDVANEYAAEVTRLRQLCWDAARHLRTLPVQSDVKDGEMARRLENEALLQLPHEDA